MEVLPDFFGDPLLGVLIQRLQLLSCLLHAHTGFKPGEGPHGKANATIHRVLRRQIHLSGENDIGRLQPRHFKFLGKNADDAHRMVVDHDGLIQDSGIAIEAA